MSPCGNAGSVCAARPQASRRLPSPKRRRLALYRREAPHDNQHRRADEVRRFSVVRPDMIFRACDTASHRCARLVLDICRAPRSGDQSESRIPPHRVSLARSSDIAHGPHGGRQRAPRRERRIGAREPDRTPRGRPSRQLRLIAAPARWLDLPQGVLANIVPYSCRGLPAGLSHAFFRPRINPTCAARRRNPRTTG